MWAGAPRSHPGPPFCSSCTPQLLAASLWGRQDACAAPKDAQATKGMLQRPRCARLMWGRSRQPGNALRDAGRRLVRLPAVDQAGLQAELRESLHCEQPATAPPGVGCACVSRTRQRGAAAACAGCAQARGQAIWKPAAQALGLEGSMSAGPGSGVPLAASSPWRGPCQGPGPPAVMAYAPQIFEHCLPALRLEESDSQ